MARAGPANAPGRTNSLLDVAGLRVGHYERTAGGYLTGTTVILAPDAGMTAGVDVRGGGPGTRETDLLAPVASVQQVHAITLTGGSAYGLAAASGVADELGRRGVGLPVGPGPGEVVPLVPAAVIFDLGRGGSFTARPGEDFGRAAVAAALSDDGTREVAAGSIGAGAGAVAGGLKGGVGGASLVLPGGATVAALIVANAYGSLVEQRDGTLRAASLLLPGDAPELRAPSGPERAALAATAARHVAVPGASPETATGGQTIRNTTLGVIATDAALSKAECTKLAAVGHDGLARAVNPIHTMFDGDTLFGVATADRPGPQRDEVQAILIAAADVVSRATMRAVLAATGARTAAGSWRSYTEVAPTAVAAYPDTPPADHRGR